MIRLSWTISVRLYSTGTVTIDGSISRLRYALATTGWFVYRKYVEFFSLFKFNSEILIIFQLGFNAEHSW